MKFYTDGFTKLKNPSPQGGGYTIINENNEVLVVENIDKVGFTNNEGELLGVWHALHLCGEFDVISTDSMNTIAWLRTNKLQKVARQDLLDIIKECKDLVAEKQVNIIWEGREHNLAGIYNEQNKIDTANVGLFKALK